MAGTDWRHDTLDRIRALIQERAFTRLIRAAVDFDAGRATTTRRK